MFGASKVSAGAPLEKFIFEWSGGYLVGAAEQPEEGAPCSNCFELWLASRRIGVTRREAEALKHRPEVASCLEKATRPSLVFEIGWDGSITELECVVFPHPLCGCSKERYTSLASVPKKANFSFSPIQQIKCARYSTPTGNLWLVSATGNCPFTGNRIQKFGVATDREEARWQAVERWLGHSTESRGLDLSADQSVIDMRSGGTGSLADLVGRKVMQNPSVVGQIGVGVGSNREEATLSALYQLSMRRTVNKHTSSGKQPLLVVGANQWIHQQLPLFVLQQYDIHVLFYPNSTPAWVIGVVAISRLRPEEAPRFAFGCHGNIQTALRQGLYRLFEQCRPQELEMNGSEVWGEKRENEESDPKERRMQLKLGEWWHRWIYRCPKIGLKEILHLESYPATVQAWRDYFADGQESLVIVPSNAPVLPSSVREIVRVISPEPAVTAIRSNVIAIGGVATTGSFSEALQ